MDKVKISFYNENSARNAVLCEITKPEAKTKLEIYFSYSTPIAFKYSYGLHVPDHKMVSKNEWASTSGKHINWAESALFLERKKRVDHDVLMENLHKICERYGFSMPEIEIT